MISAPKSATTTITASSNCRLDTSTRDGDKRDQRERVAAAQGGDRLEQVRQRRRRSFVEQLGELPVEIDDRSGVPQRFGEEAEREQCSRQQPHAEARKGPPPMRVGG